MIYRRCEEDYVTTGLPQLNELSLEGKVNIVNALGVGVADDKSRPGRGGRPARPQRSLPSPVGPYDRALCLGG